MILSSQSSLICGWTFVKVMHTNKHCKCFYSHIHATEMGLGANCNILAHYSCGGGTRKDLLELVRPVLLIHCRTESEYGFCLEIAVHAHREREEVTNSTAYCHQLCSLTSCNNHQIESQPSDWSTPPSNPDFRSSKLHITLYCSFRRRLVLFPFFNCREFMYQHVC